MIKSWAGESSEKGGSKDTQVLLGWVSEISPVQLFLQHYKESLSKS